MCNSIFTTVAHPSGLGVVNSIPLLTHPLHLSTCLLVVVYNRTPPLPSQVKLSLSLKSGDGLTSECLQCDFYWALGVIVSHLIWCPQLQLGDFNSPMDQMSTQPFYSYETDFKILLSSIKEKLKYNDQNAQGGELLNFQTMGLNPWVILEQRKAVLRKVKMKLGEADDIICCALSHEYCNGDYRWTDFPTRNWSSRDTRFYSWPIHYTAEASKEWVN